MLLWPIEENYFAAAPLPTTYAAPATAAATPAPTSEATKYNKDAKKNHSGANIALAARLTASTRTVTAATAATTTTTFASQQRR